MQTSGGHHLITRSSLLTKTLGIVSLLLAIAFAVSACTPEESETEHIITPAASFSEDSRVSREEGLPIVVFVSQHGCEYCELLRQQVLHPMIRAGDFQKKAILREVSLDPGFTVDDFDNTRIEGSQFSSRYAAAITPTLIFLNAEGREIADKIVGVNNVEYYSFYLDKALAKARSKMDRE